MEMDDSYYTRVDALLNEWSERAVDERTLLVDLARCGVGVEHVVDSLVFSRRLPPGLVDEVLTLLNRLDGEDARFAERRVQAYAVECRLMAGTPVSDDELEALIGRGTFAIAETSVRLLSPSQARAFAALCESSNAFTRRQRHTLRTSLAAISASRTS